MTIPLVGWLLLAAGMLLVLARRRALGTVAVFFVPFSATAVLTLERYELSLLAWTFFGGLWLVTDAADRALMADGERMAPDPGLRALWIFVAVAAVSLVMPFAINGSLMYTTADRLASVPLRFSPWHVVHLVYLVFGVAMATRVAAISGDPSRLATTLRVVVWSGAIASAIGYGELIFYAMGRRYPLYALNTAASGNLAATGGARVLDELGVSAMRVSSVAEEPSFLAQHLLAIVPLLLVSVMTRVAIVSRRFDALALAAMLGLLLLSTSATAYAGLAAMLVCAPLVLRWVGVARAGWRYVALVAFVAMLGAVGYARVGGINAFVNQYLLGKLQTGSAVGRFASLAEAWEHFQVYPLLGVGWGIVPAYDLALNLLVHVGVIGLLAFAVAMALLILRLKTVAGRVAADETKRAVGVWSVGVALALLTLAVAIEASGFGYQFGSLWVLCGLAVACRRVWERAAAYQPREWAARLPTAAVPSHTADPTGGDR